MQIDKKKLKQLLDLSDEDIKQKVVDAVSSSAFDKKDKETLDKALQNMKDLKKAISNIDEESIKKAVDALGADKIDTIKKNLNI